MMRSRLHQQHGMTLLEILLYVSISGLVIFAASSVLTTIYEVKNKGRVMQAVEEEGTLIAYTIDRHIQNASQVFQPEMYKESDVLSVTVVNNNKESNVVISLVDGILYNQTDNGAKIALTTNNIVISNLKFKYFGASEKGFLNYSFTVSSADTSGRYDYSKTFSSGASLR
ncbi:MAG: hypothetical protein KBB70_00325 [Candidatus Pacebacteria bacterium]|jgi:type II secretory pathway pseudopilin PulG|nr:hypothetical protein [Candidatus Paceibacterota bacterium]